MLTLLVFSIPALPWYAVLIPAAVTALVIRADARLIGPYWTFLELIPGLEGVDADFWYERPTLWFAIIRRYAYVASAGAVMAIVRDEWSVDDAALLGAAVVGLLLWPIVFHGLPYGVLRRDWQLIPLYIGVVASFVSASVVGRLAVDYVNAQADGHPLDWVKENAAEAIFWAVVGATGTAFFRGSYQSLREKKRDREQAEML